MKLGSYIYFDIKLKKIDFLDTPFCYKGEKIGKISKTEIKGNTLWIEMTIDSKKIKKIRKLLGL